MKPARLPNFESQARRLRYQALGAACRDRSITSLLLAHHEDDQAETIFWRLIQGHAATGLLGMQPMANIPECHGLYGVHQSGTREFEERRRAKPYFRRHEWQRSMARLGEDPNGPLTFEEGGLKIYRPLLEFSKKRLVQTCRDSQVQWWEDRTNRDPTLTPRNAVRHLLRNRRLPRSLQKPSLLAMRERMIEKAKARTARVKKSFEACDINLLDTRSGSLVVRLKTNLMGTKLIPPAYRQLKLAETKHRAALVLRQFLEIIAPRERISLKSLQFAVHVLYPDLKDPTATSLDKHLEPSRFTAGGVLFERSPLPLERPQHNPGHQLDAEFIWVLSRQRPASTQSSIIQIDPPSDPECHSGQPQHSPDESPINQTTPAPSPSESDLSFNSRRPLARRPKESRNQSIREFRLWDSRYWFLIHNPTPFPLLVRFLHVDDLRQLRTSLPSTQVKQLDQLLRTAAPGKIRWTLPVLVQKKTEQGAEPGVETVLALPTLGWDCNAEKLGVSYEVRYKQIDLGDRKDVIIL